MENGTIGRGGLGNCGGEEEGELYAESGCEDTFGGTGGWVCDKTVGGDVVCTKKGGGDNVLGGGLEEVEMTREVVPIEPFDSIVKSSKVSHLVDTRYTTVQRVKVKRTESTYIAHFMHDFSLSLRLGEIFTLSI